MKTTIKNRKGQNIVVVVEIPENPKGLAFVMHGLGAIKEQPQIETMARAFYDNGYVAVRFDVANTIGESGGSFENASVSSYYEDLEDVVSWAKSQNWYIEPFVLAGSSLGAMCSVLFAERYPGRVKALAPKAASISGRMLLPRYNQDDLKKWEETGWQISESNTKPGVIKKLNWNNFREDLLRYDILDKASALMMPVLIVVGENDTVTPAEDQKVFYEKIPGRKEFHVIPGAGHTMREPKVVSVLYGIFDKWIKTL